MNNMLNDDGAAEGDDVSQAILRHRRQAELNAAEPVEIKAVYCPGLMFTSPLVLQVYGHLQRTLIREQQAQKQAKIEEAEKN